MKGGYVPFVLLLLILGVRVSAESPATRIFGEMQFAEPAYETPQLWLSPDENSSVAQTSYLQDLNAASLSPEPQIQLPYSTPVNDQPEEEQWIQDAWATPAFPVQQALGDAERIAARTDWEFGIQYLIMRRGEPDYSQTTPFPVEYGPNHGFRFMAKKFDDYSSSESTEFVFQRVAGSDPFRLGSSVDYVEQSAESELLDFQVNRVFDQAQDDWSLNRKVGLRIMSLRDEFNLHVRSFDDSSQLEGKAENFLVGLNGQMAGRWHANRMYVGAGIGGGLHVNIASSSVSDLATSSASFNENQIAVTADLDLFTGIQITERTSFEIGYQGLGLLNVLSTADQQDFISQDSGIVFYHGVRISLAHHF